MTGSFHYHRFGDLFVLVHAATSPDDTTWSRYVAEYGRVDRPRSFPRALVLSDGGGPSGAQRKALEEVAGDDDRAAIVSASALPRFVVSMLTLRTPNIQAFAPREIDEAMRFLDLSSAERREVAAHVSELRRKGDLGSLRVLDAAFPSVG